MLGRRVGGGASAGPGQGAATGAAAEAKVDRAHLQQPTGLLGVAGKQHDVGGLEVSIVDVAPVALDEQVQHTLHDGCGLMLAAGALRGQVLLQGPAHAQFLHDVHLVLILGVGRGAADRTHMQQAGRVDERPAQHGREGRRQASPTVAQQQLGGQPSARQQDDRSCVHAAEQQPSHLKQAFQLGHKLAGLCLLPGADLALDGIHCALALADLGQQLDGVAGARLCVHGLAHLAKCAGSDVLPQRVAAVEGGGRVPAQGCRAAARGSQGPVAAARRRHCTAVGTTTLLMGLLREVAAAAGRVLRRMEAAAAPDAAWLLSTCAAAGAAADCSSLAAVVLQVVREGVQQPTCCMTAWCRPVLF